MCVCVGVCVCARACVCVGVCGGAGRGGGLTKLKGAKRRCRSNAWCVGVGGGGGVKNRERGVSVATNRNPPAFMEHHSL